MTRLAGRLARLPISTALTATIIVGGPWALWHFLGPPIPTAIPSRDAIGRWLNDPIGSTSLISVVTVILWLAWAVVVWLLAVEVYGAIRHVKAPRIRLAAPLQTVAAGLVGATATAIGGTAAHAAPPAGPPSTPVADVPAHPAGVIAGEGSASAQSSVVESVDVLRYRVAAGDWMVGIAQRFLGDPDAYSRLAALNAHLADDSRFPDHIEPGWELTLPADAFDRGEQRHATGTTLGTAPAAGPEVAPAATTPRPAETPTGSPPPSPAAKPPTPTPSGSTYPVYDDDDDLDSDGVHSEHIEDQLEGPGSQLGAMSGAGLLASLVLLALQAERRRQTQHRRPGQRLPNPRDGRTERDLRVAEAPADVHRLDLALRHLAAALANHPHQPDIIGIRMIGGDVQLLLAADSEHPPQPWLDEGTHWVLPADVPLVELPDQDQPLPSLTAVGSRAGRHLLLDLERHGVLSLTGDRAKAVDLLRYMVCELACSTWSEDAEITIAGFDEAESQLLRELNWHRVRVTTDVADAIGQLRRHVTANRQALAALGLADTVAGRVQSIATDAWTPRLLLIADLDDQARAALAALRDDLALGGRCAVAAVAVTDDTAPIGPATVTLADDGLLTVTAPPLRTTTGAARLPATELDKLAEILRLARTTDLHHPTDTDQTAAPPAAEQPSTDDGPADPVDDEPLDGAEAITGLYDPTAWAQPGDLPTPATSAQTEPPHSQTTPTRISDELDQDLHDWHTRDTTRPRIAILGPVTVTGHGRPLEARTAFHTEIVVYLAAHPRGADRYQIEEAIWPGREIVAGGLKVAMARTRSWLGPDWLADAKETRLYKLSPGYLFDWHLFRRLVARAKTRGHAGTEDLRAALELVRGRPLHGADVQLTGRKPYTWLDTSEISPPHLVAVIGDAAHELARRYLDDGDTTGARWAVNQAWAADPERGHDEPWIDIMRAERIDGHRAELEHIHAQLLITRGVDVPEDLAPTTYRDLLVLMRP